MCKGFVVFCFVWDLSTHSLQGYFTDIDKEVILKGMVTIDWYQNIKPQRTEKHLYILVCNGLDVEFLVPRDLLNLIGI